MTRSDCMIRGFFDIDDAAMTSHYFYLRMPVDMRSAANQCREYQDAKKPS